MKKLCTFVGCKAIVESSGNGVSPRCDKHKREYNKSAHSDRRSNYEHHYDENGKNIYHTARWKKLRARKAKMNPLCEHCQRYGIAKPVEEVDHILSILDGGEIWDIDNLQSLCRRHHAIKTRQEEKARKVKTDRFGYIVDTRNKK